MKTLLVLLIVSTFVGTAFAASDDDLDDCEDGDVAACTRVIKDKASAAESRSFAYGIRAYEYALQGKHDLAIADYTDSISLGAPNLVYRGDVYVQKGELDLAIADYTEAIQRHPSHASAYESRGKAYERKGEKAKASADFAKAKDLVASRSPPADGGVGGLMDELGKLPKK